MFPALVTRVIDELINYTFFIEIAKGRRLHKYWEGFRGLPSPFHYSLEATILCVLPVDSKSFNYLFFLIL